MTPPRWWPPAGLLLLLALAFGPTLATGGLLAIGDGLGYYLPARAIAAASVQHGELPFWNPYNFAGMPLLAAFQGGIFFPANWAFLVLPPGAAMNLAVLLGYAMAGLATYAYVRALGLARSPAFLAGACFMGGGYMVAHLEHLTMLHGAGMLPAMLWAVERHATTARQPYMLALAGALALQIFAGYPQTVIVSLPLVAAYALWRHGTTWRPLVGVAAALALGIGLGMVQLLPASAMLATSERGHLGYAALVETSLPPRQLASFVFPFLFGAVPSGPFPTPYWGGGQWPNELMGYMGLAPLMLAIAALGAWRRQSAVRFWAPVAALTTLLALGGATPLYRVWAVLPVLQAVRVPGRHLLEVDLALAVLAGCGLAWVLEGAPARRWALAGAGVVVAGAGAGLAGLAAVGPRLAAHWQALVPPASDLARTLSPTYPGAWIPVLLALIAAALVVASTRWRACQAGVVLVTLLDLGLFGQCWGWRQLSPHPAEAPPMPPVPAAHGRVLAIDPSGYPFNDYARMHQLGYPQLGALWGVEPVGGYEPIANARYQRLVGGISPSGALPDGSLLAPTHHALDLLGCREVRLAPGGMLAPEPPRWQQVGPGHFTNPRALPAAWRVARAEVGDVDAKVVGRLPFEPATTALLDEGPAPVGLVAGPAELAWHGFNHLEVLADGPALAVLGVAYDPGWQPTDPAVHVRRVDGLLLGLELPAGSHGAALAYEPPRWRAGLALSLASLVVALGWARRGRGAP